MTNNNDFYRDNRATMDYLHTDNPQYRKWMETLRLDWLKNFLGEVAPLKGDYKFGEKGNVRFQHNLLDELTNKLVEKLYFNKYEEINPQFELGTTFGKKNNWYTKLKGGEGNIGFDIGVKF